MSRSHRLAWAAGFIDGDGFITIQNRNQKINGKQYRGHYLRVGACQASLVPLEILQSIFGGKIIKKHGGPNPHNYNRKQQWSWSLSTQQAADALEQMLPYLIHKKEVAQIALEFQSTMGTTKRVSEETLAKRVTMQIKIQDINSLS